MSSRIGLLLLTLFAANMFAANIYAHAQDSSTPAHAGEARVPLPQIAVAHDAYAREALVGTLLTQDLAGSPDSPVKNVRIVLRSRASVLYNYAQGWATFYADNGVRCGEGLWKVEALAPDEQAEVDTPGLRLTCRPATWRIIATTLLTPTTDVEKPQVDATPAAVATAAEPAPPPTGSSLRTAIPPLEVNVNGKTIPVQLGNPLEIVVGKERVRIVVQPAPE